MPKIQLTIAGLTFMARLEEQLAPKTCACFLALLPYESQVIHVRWSGEGVWIPWGDQHFDLPYENATSHPAPGEMILYPGGVSECEFLLAYGPVSFASKAGPLAGNHFLTITDGLEQLQTLGRTVLWEGAQSFQAIQIPDSQGG